MEAINDDEKKKILDSINWEIEYPEYVAYGISILRKYRILDGNICISGSSVEDIVQNAIKKLFSGDRSWDPNKVNIEAWIKMTIQSEVSNLANLKSSKNELSLEEISCRSNEEFESLEIEIFATEYNDDGYSIDPLILVISQTELKETTDLLLEIASNDPIIEKMILAILDGIESKPSILAEYIGVDITEIYNANKRLDRLMLKFKDLRYKHEK